MKIVGKSFYSEIQICFQNPYRITRLEVRYVYFTTFRVCKSKDT